MRALQGRSRETLEVARLLRQYAVDATVFDALSPSAQSVQLLVADSSELNQHQSDPLAQSVELASRLSRTMMYAAEPATFETAYVPITSSVLDFLRPQQQSVEQAINEKLASPGWLGVHDLAAYGFARAQCLMVKVYIAIAWTGRQLDYDDAIDLFREITDVSEGSLQIMHSLIDGITPTDARAAFSIGLPAQATLMLLIQQCRDRDIRHRAMKLLDKCPRYHGVRDTVLVKAICRAIITFEETLLQTARQISFRKVAESITIV